jgi:hypothetical protein
MIAVGFLAKQYRMLPSEVLARATTYDLMIADVWSAWQENQSKSVSDKNYKTEDLEKIIEKAKL